MLNFSSRLRLYHYLLSGMLGCDATQFNFDGVNELLCQFFELRGCFFFFLLNDLIELILIS